MVILRHYTTVFCILLSGLCLNAQEVPEWDFADFETQSQQKSDTLQVFNFWATWCAPCVKELPYFETLAKEWTPCPIRVWYLSLDFPKAYPERLLTFIKDKGLKQTVVWLNAAGENTWIPKVNPDWSGAIPATFVVPPGKGKPFFTERAFDSKEELIHWLEQNITP